MPPRFPASVIAPTVRAAASLYAAVRSSCACADAGLAMYFVPASMPGGKPVTEVPGLRPRLPLMADAPVLVTVAAANTAYDAAAPRFGATSVLTSMELDGDTLAFFDAVCVGGLAAPTVAAKTIARGSIAMRRIPGFMDFSCLKRWVRLNQQSVISLSRRRGTCSAVRGSLCALG